MSSLIELTSAEHSGDYDLLDPTMRFDLIPNTTANFAATLGRYKLVTTKEIIGPDATDVSKFHAVLVSLSQGENIPVVVKLAETDEAFDALIREGRVYAELEPLVKQSLLPICYGAFRARVVGEKNIEKTPGCLILQYCGDCMQPTSYDRATNEGQAIRYQLLDTLMEMHRLGVQHEDLSLRNFTVLRDDVVRKPYIVGLTKATTGHKCKCSKTAEDLWGILEPSRDEVNCAEIFEACKLLSVFPPNRFICFQRYHSVAYIESVKLEEVANRAPEGWDRAEALKEAYDAMLQYTSKWFPDIAEDLKHEIGPQIDQRARDYAADASGVSSVH